MEVRSKPISQLSQMSAKQAAVYESPIVGELPTSGTFQYFFEATFVCGVGHKWACRIHKEVTQVHPTDKVTDSAMQPDINASSVTESRLQRQLLETQATNRHKSKHFMYGNFCIFRCLRCLHLFSSWSDCILWGRSGSGGGGSSSNRWVAGSNSILLSHFANVSLGKTHLTTTLVTQIERRRHFFRSSPRHSLPWGIHYSHCVCRHF